MEIQLECCAYMGLRLSGVRFFFANKIRIPVQSPADVGMKDSDVIGEVLRQRGGGCNAGNPISLKLRGQHGKIAHIRVTNTTQFIYFMSEYYIKGRADLNVHDSNTLDEH